MKRILTLAVALIFALSMAGFSFAADPGVANAPAAKKKARVKAARVHRMIGEVVSHDAATNTLTIKTKKGEEKFTTTEKTLVRPGKKKTLADLKAGEKVSVHYTGAGESKTATLVYIFPAKKAMKKKAAPKKSETGTTGAAPETK